MFDTAITQWLHCASWVVSGHYGGLNCPGTILSCPGLCPGRPGSGYMPLAAINVNSNLTLYYFRCWRSCYWSLASTPIYEMKISMPLCMCW